MKLIAIGVWLAFGISAARGQEDKFTQIGTSECKGVPHSGSFTCQDVTFAPEFGDKPQVIVVLSTASLGRAVGGTPGPSHRESLYGSASVGKLTRQGFTPIYKSTGSGQTLEGGGVVLSWIAIGSRLYAGSGIGRYLILGVVYAPPGNALGKAASVTYAHGSNIGTTVSASNSFKVSNKLTMDFGSSLLGSDVSTSFDASVKNSNSQELDIKESDTSQLVVSGPNSVDGIDHDFDQIYILLKPKIGLKLSATAAQWSLETSKYHIYPLTVGQLRKTQPISIGLAAELASAGITDLDFKEILKQDPLADGSAPDPLRFEYYGGEDYLPPGAVKQYARTLTTTTTHTDASTTDLSYGVGLTLEEKLEPVVAHQSLKSEHTWEWTNSNSESHTEGDTYSASYMLTQPTATWKGFTWCEIYFDKRYKTWAFYLIPPTERTLLAHGNVYLDASKTTAPHVEVTLTRSGIQYKTWTNENGQYVFRLPAKDKVSVSSTSQEFTVTDAAQNITIK